LTVSERGHKLFSIDQQPYLQSMLSVTVLAAHIDFGTNLPVTNLPVKPVLTDPLITDARTY